MLCIALSPMISLLTHIYWLCISAISAWLLMHAMEFLIQISRLPLKRWLMLFSCWLLTNVVIQIGDSFNILAILPCFLAIIFFTCEGSLWKKLTVGAMYASTIFSFNALRDNFLKYPFRTQIYTNLYIYLQTYTPFIRVYTSTVSCLFAVFLYLGIKKFAPDKNYTLSDSLWKLLFLLTATPLGITLCATALFSRSTWNTTSAFRRPTEYIVLLSISLLSFVSLLWCIMVLAKQQKLEQQNMFMEVNRKYYESMEQQHFEIRRLKHDLANHMQVLSALPKEQQASYIQNLANLTADMQPLSYCGDATVNAVLSVKKTTMDQCSIRPKISVDIPSPLPFDKTDICALYANALDNAIEACRQLPESERTISIRSKARKGLFCLKVRNPISASGENPDFPVRDIPQKGMAIPPTTKADKKNHGLGLKGMKEIVSRYHGNMELKKEDGIFELFLYIPLNYQQSLL